MKASRSFSTTTPTCQSRRSFSWRDPVDRQKNIEEEIYENYRQVSGVMAPYNVTRLFNGDMSSQRFLNSVTINQGLDEAMFDPRVWI